MSETGGERQPARQDGPETRAPSHRDGPPALDGAPAFEPPLAGPGFDPRAMNAASPLPPKALLPLQRQVGNAAVSRLLARQGLAPMRITDEQLEARAARGNRSERELIDAAMRSRSAGDVKAITNYGAATAAERITFIDIVSNQGWVGPMDEYALESLWGSFGDGLLAQADAHPEFWRRSVEGGMDPSNIQSLNRFRLAFQTDVKGKAKDFMRLNLLFCRGEMEKFGFRAGEGGQSPTAETEREMHLQETQELAQATEKLMQSKDRMRQIHVGFNMVMHPSAGGATVPVNFDPEHPPTTREPSFFQRDTAPRPQKTWDEVKEQWDNANAAVAYVTAQNPTVFAALGQGRENVQALATGNPEQAKQTARTVLNALQTNITNTYPKLDSGDLDWRDLVPIHQQLYGGARGASGVDWSKPAAKSLAEDVIGDHESTQFWINLGLGTAAAALFIVAEVASGGLATAALLGGLAIGGGQAAASWENYADLASAAASTASEETRLVSEGQVDAARFQAILDTVLAFVDIAGPVLRGARAARAAARLESAVASRGAQAALGQMAQLPADQAGKAVLRGIEELGVEATMRQSGKSLDELTAAVRAIQRTDENAAQLSAVLSRLESARAIGIGAAAEGGQVVAGAEARAAIVATGSTAENAWKGSRSVAELVADVPNAVKSGTITREFGDRVISEAIDRLGPAQVLQQAGGWERLAKTLTDSSAAGEKLMRWRNSIFSDLEDYVVRELQGQVQRTGTAGKFSNDIDMSFTGANAAAVREQAAEYLARRMGVENSPQSFNLMMVAGLFTDPRRMHAYDMLPAAVRDSVAARQAAKQEQLIWNRRLYEAVHEGDEALATQIREQMQGMGINEFRYRPLSSGDITRLSQRVDGLWGQLEAAHAAGDMAKVQRLSEQIGESQALINAAEGGGYFSAGGVRRYVTERPGEPGFPRLPGGAGAGVPPVERLTAILDQVSKLDHEALKLSGSAEDVVAAVRGIGKYGGRLNEVIAEAGMRADVGPWAQLAERCRELKAAADAGAVASRITAGQADAVVREAREAFSQLIGQSEIALQFARQGVQMPQIADAARRLQYMTMAHVKLLRSIDFILGHMEIMSRAVRTGTGLASIPESQGAPQPAAPMSSPDQNFTPGP